MPELDIGKQLKAGKADPIIDLALGSGKFTELNALIDKHVIDKVEQKAIIQETKQKFSANFSRVAAQKLQAFASPKMSDSDSFISHERYKRGTYGGGDYLDNSAHAYESATSGRFYKARRKIVDLVRVQKKSPVKFIKLPFTLIPGGEIAVKYTFKGIEAVTKAMGTARKARKRQKYDAANLDSLSENLGEKEALRKIAKWHAKDISDLGQKLQRNLAKLKQAAVLLDNRQVVLERLIESTFSIDGLHHDEFQESMKIKKARNDVAMSYHEVKHYINKIQQMCFVMQATSVDVTAHITCFDAYLDETKELVDWSFNH
ncbi:hypothetical protein AB733_08980 [Photobacterium swingsii]|uniref:Uncharacterized protein n=1 Tax=Photobacterium swingsii TaxID=680026 RepID=A0A0J8VDE7_9GAMM|nr:hypothetical protein [Photobacterium swingsii]KMV31102.1 hypothetical protein AB733_08980 [Photobacterium swingsii]PSW23603.1 hypothetical protein C9I94_15930 [Photobacterium swingsii]